MRVGSVLGMTSRPDGASTESAADGPRLDDHAFFTGLLDRSRPLLDQAAARAEQGDFGQARALFARDVRETLQPERFLQIDRTFIRPGEHVVDHSETIEDAAERILSGVLVSCGTPIDFSDGIDWFANPTHNQYAEWTWQLSRHHEWGILAERYRATGDERFAEGFLRYFRSWVRQATAPARDAAVGSGQTLCWRTIELGIRMGGSWPWVLHTFVDSPAFTDDDLVDFCKSVWEHGERLRNRHARNNWLIMEMNGLAQIGLLYPQLVDASEWKAYALDRLAAELPVQTYPDGFQFELSTNYHQVNISNYQWVWDVYDAYGEPVPPEFRSWLELMHEANLRIARPDGRLPDLGDGRDHPVAELMTAALPRYPERPDFRWAASQGTEGTPPPWTSSAFDYAGYYVMRTGWESDAVWALVDAGPYGMAHQHEDKLSVLLHAYGRTLITEGGNYAYDDSSMRRYVLSSRAHNTILVDGQGQNRRLHFDRSRVTMDQPSGSRWYSDDHQDLVAATYDEGYGPEADPSVTHRRTVWFDKRGVADTLGPHLVVVDRLLAAPGRTHDYQAVWHLDPDEAEVEDGIVRTTTPGEANVTLLAAGPPGLSTTIISGRTEPEWQGWKSIKEHLQGQYAATPTASSEFSAAGPVRLVTVLYPSARDADCPITEVVADPAVDATTVTLRLASGQTVTVDEADWPE